MNADWKGTYSDSLSVHVLQVCRPSRQLGLRLVRLVYVSSDSTLHEPSGMVDCSFNDTISDSLRNNVLGLFLRLEIELYTNVSDRDSRVRKRDCAEGSLDDEMT